MPWVDFFNFLIWLLDVKHLFNPLSHLSVATIYPNINKPTYVIYSAGWPKKANCLAPNDQP